MVSSCRTDFEATAMLFVIDTIKRKISDGDTNVIHIGIPPRISSAAAAGYYIRVEVEAVFVRSDSRLDTVSLMMVRIPYPSTGSSRAVKRRHSRRGCNWVMP